MNDLKQPWSDIIGKQLAADDDDVNLSDDDVNGILLKIGVHQHHIDAEKDKLNQAVAYFKKFIDNAKEIFDTETKDDTFAIEELKLKLQRYYDANPPKGRKSHKFAAGSFGYNKAQTKFFFKDKEANADNADLLQFCYKNGYPEYVKTKEYLDWAALKKSLDFYDAEQVFFADTNEVVPELRAQKIFSVKTL